jgi:CDP-glycerol glycerophosphotransferase
MRESSVPVPPRAPARPKVLSRLLGRAARRDEPADDGPTVSVIIPFYNVEPYIEETLESVLTQDLDDIEVVLVDDGSTDGTRAIVDRIAASDDRVRVLTQPNGGPGVAREKAIPTARGRYLMFVDSDDVLLPGAIRLLVTTAEKDDVQIVVAAATRFNATRTWMSAWVVEMHARERHGVTVDETPELVRNNYPWGKLYRRDFWMAQDLHSVDTKIFSDQPLITLLYVRAERITVLTDLVYKWRSRDDRSSVSQRPEDIGNLELRVKAWQRSAAAIPPVATPATTRAWLLTIFRSHIYWYLDNEAIADPRYWATLRDAVLELLAIAPNDVLDDVTAERRVGLLLLAADAHAELLAYRDAGGFDLAAFELTEEADGLRHLLPVTGGIVPADAALTPWRAVQPRNRVVRGSLDLDSLVFDGFVSLPFRLPMHEDAVVVWAEHDDGERVEGIAAPRAIGDDGLQESAELVEGGLPHLGYRATFDLAALSRPGGWTFGVTVQHGEHPLETLASGVSARGNLLDIAAVVSPEGDRSTLLAGRNRFAALRLRVDSVMTRVRAVELSGDELTVTVASRKPTPLEVLELKAPRAGAQARFEATSDTYRARVAVPPTDGPLVWVVRARDRNGAAVPMAWAHDVIPLEEAGLRVSPSAAGNLRVERLDEDRLEVDRVERTPWGARVAVRRESASGTEHSEVEVRGAEDGAPLAGAVLTAPALAQLPIRVGPNLSLVRGAGRTLELRADAD